MQEDRLTTTIQTIKGMEHRIAGNNYIENTFNQPTNIKQWRESASMDTQDQLAIHNEIFFIRRFGFDVPRQQRRHTIAVKNYFDFTEREITKLKRSRLFTLIKGKPTSLCADKWVWFTSFTEIALYTIVLGGLAILVNFGVAAPMPRLIGVLSFLTMYLGLLFMENRLAIEPMHILQRRGFKLGDHYIFIDPDDDNSMLIEKINTEGKPNTFLIEFSN